jgi:hypothetical protein
MVAGELGSWKTPLKGWIEVNIDGFFVEQTGAVCVGVIARRHIQR